MAAFDSSRTTSTCSPSCRACAELRRAAVALGGSMGLASITPGRLAEVAALPEPALAAHVCGDVDVCVAAAYQETIEGMQSRYAARLRAAATREDALRDATRDLLAHLARHPAVAAFVTIEVLGGNRELLELRERLRRQSVANIRRELARFDGAGVAPELQVEMIVGTMTHAIARRVSNGETATLPDLLEPVLTVADARMGSDPLRCTPGG